MNDDEGKKYIYVVIYKTGPPTWYKPHRAAIIRSDEMPQSMIEQYLREGKVVLSGVKWPHQTLDDAIKAIEKKPTVRATITPVTNVSEPNNPAGDNYIRETEPDEGEQAGP